MVTSVSGFKIISILAWSSIRVFLTDAEDYLVDVNGGEVQEEEGKVDDEKEEAQNHTQPLLQSLT